MATDGWAEVASCRPPTWPAVRVRWRAAIVYTDIARDGMMQGCNVEAPAAAGAGLSIPVIASGGITNLDDIRAPALRWPAWGSRRHHRPRDLRGHPGRGRGAAAVLT